MRSRVFRYGAATLLAGVALAVILVFTTGGGAGADHVPNHPAEPGPPEGAGVTLEAKLDALEAKLDEIAAWIFHPAFGLRASDIHVRENHELLCIIAEIHGSVPGLCEAPEPE